MRYLKVYNGHVITPAGVIKNGCVVMANGVITGVHRENIAMPDADVIDAQGAYISPGFIDMHVHGGGGHDFMDNTVEAFLEAAAIHARHGTTAMMPTTLSCGQDELLKTLSVYEEAAAVKHNGAQFIGIHIEGPYFAMSQRGAQDPRYIHNPDPEEYKTVLSSTPSVKRWSVAPELPGALEMGRYLRERHILPSIAHTDAVYEEVIPAFNAGYTHATHFYSAMSGVTRRNAFRYAGVVESAYLIDDMTVEIIADGVHLPAPLLKLVYKLKGPDKTALITDAMRAAGLPEGPSILGSLHNGQPVIVEDGVAKLPDRSAFAGSIATTDRLVRVMMEQAEIPLFDAVKMMSATPAAILHIQDRKGSIAKGKDADLVIFNDAISIQATIVNGEIIYRAGQ